jgi:flagellin-like protein
MKAIRIAGKRSRKAVSPVVATVILVLISVVAGVMLWLWVSGFTSAATAPQPALYERIKIESANITKTDSTTGRLIAYVRNVGSVPVNITAVYLFDANNTLVMSFLLSSATQIKPGEVKRVAQDTISLASIRNGLQYTVKVVTRNGVEATYAFVASY